MDTVSQSLFNQTITPGTHLGRIARIDQYYTTNGTLSLLHRVNYQLSPRSIGYALGEAVIPGHSFDVQVLKTDDVVFVEQSMAQLMAKVSAFIGNPFVDTGDDLALSGILGSFLFGLTKPPLGFGEGLLFLTEETGVGDLLAAGEHGEGSQSQINADILAGFGQGFRLNFSRKAGEPFASGIAPNSHGLNLPFNGAMQSDWNSCIGSA